MTNAAIGAEVGDGRPTAEATGAPPVSWAQRRAARLVARGAAATAIPSVSSTRLPTLSATSSGRPSSVVPAANSPRVWAAVAVPRGHADLIASGRTGEPVAPYRLSGISTNVNVAQPAPESRSRSIASTM